MKKLNDRDYQLFKNLCGLSQKSVRKTMLSLLKSKYKTIYATKDYIMAIGDVPIALVAHMDTVFTSPPLNIYYDREQGIMWSPDGLGADDRAGVFGIIKIVQNGLRPTIILTTDEEKGGLGADCLIRDFKEAPVKLNYIIQLDRRGIRDCVFYDCENLEFTKYIESFGFKENFGSFSDISTICPEWGVAGVNLSIGYENEHSYFETLDVKAMFSTLTKVIKMINSDNIPEFKYISGFCKYGYNYGYGYGLARKYPYYYDFEDDNVSICEDCKQAFPEYMMIPCKSKYGGIKYYCPDCCVDNVKWCEECGEAFEPKESDDTKCDICKNKEKEKVETIGKRRNQKNSRAV